MRTEKSINVGLTRYLMTSPSNDHNASIKDRFGPAGWLLVEELLEPTTVKNAKLFLESRRANLQRQFETWVGSPLEEKGYGWHQGQLADYESRDLPKDLRHFLRGEFDLETRLDKVLVSVLSTPACREWITGFLKSDGYVIHYPPMVRFKVADAPNSILPPHQDAPYSEHLREFLTIWVPLVQIDDDCGGILVYNGSHTMPLEPHIASGAWEAKATGDHSRFPTEHVIMDAGDILVFPSTLLHESAPHRSSRTRYSIDFRVVARPEDTTKSYFDPFSGTITRKD